MVRVVCCVGWCLASRSSFVDGCLVRERVMLVRLGLGVLVGVGGRFRGRFVGVGRGRWRLGGGGGLGGGLVLGGWGGGGGGGVGRGLVLWRWWRWRAVTGISAILLCFGLSLVGASVAEAGTGFGSVFSFGSPEGFSGALGLAVDGSGDASEGSVYVVDQG